MRNITLALLVLALTGCASQPVQKITNPQAKTQSQRALYEAIAAFRSGKISTASQAIERSLTLDPGNGLSYNLRALTRQRLGQFDNATKDFQKAVELAPEDATIRNNFGTLLCTQKHFAAAEQNFLYAADISSNTEPEIAYTNAGLCSERAGDGTKAWQYFEKAISQNPGQPTSLYHLSQISLSSGKAIQANTYLTQYRNHAPHTAKTLFLAARIEHAMGNQLGVQDYIDKMQAQHPNAKELRQARQLIDPISKQLAPTPNYPNLLAFEPPPSLAAPVSNNPQVAVKTLESPVVPIATPIPVPMIAPVPIPTSVASTPLTPAVEEQVAITTQPAATSEGISAFVSPEPVVSVPVIPVAVTETVTKVEEAAPASPFPPRSGPVKVKDSAWILQQDAKHYTLQILAAENADRLDDLIALDVAPDTLARFQFSRHDKVWHNLVLGTYAKNSDAQAALNALPEELKALRPWIRPFRSLQRVISNESASATSN